MEIFPVPAHKSKMFKYITWLGKNVTLIYVIQWIIVGNIGTAIYKTVVCPLYISLSVLGVIVVSSGIAYLVLKLMGNYKTNE